MWDEGVKELSKHFRGRCLIYSGAAMHDLGKLRRLTLGRHGGGPAHMHF